MAKSIRINWNKVIELAQAGSSKKQICKGIGITMRQMDIECKKKHKKTFANLVKKKKRDTPGHPPIEINWANVDKFLQAQCNGAQIATFMGIHPDTLYGACERDKRMGFSAYSQQKKAEGKELIRLKQFQLAVTGEGDKSMLIWLGKQYLEQADKKEVKKEDITAPASEYDFSILTKKDRSTVMRLLKKCKVHEDSGS